MHHVQLASYGGTITCRAVEIFRVVNVASFLGLPLPLLSQSYNCMAKHFEVCMVGHMAHLVGHEKLHDTLSIGILLLTTMHDCHNIERQPFHNRFLYDFDYSHISLMVGQEDQPLWKVHVIGHLATWKRPMACTE